METTGIRGIMYGLYRVYIGVIYIYIYLRPPLAPVLARILTLGASLQLQPGPSPPIAVQNSVKPRSATWHSA